jgi:hypothetical protein
MVSFGHTAVGVIVGVTTFQYLGQADLATGLIIAGSAGVISHYIADFIPHGHFNMPKGYKKDILKIIVFDLFLSIILFLGITYLKQGFSRHFWYILFGIGGSQLPDVIDGLIYTNLLKAKGILKAENNLHEAVHWHGVLHLGKKDIWQVLVVITALIWIFFKL